MATLGLPDLEYRAEFERQQFDLYEARRLAAETHANAVIAAALPVAALVVVLYGRKSHPGVGWLIVALVGLAWAFIVATIARSVSWTTSLWLGGARPTPGKVLPSDLVGSTLAAVRDFSSENQQELPRLVMDHWRARALSARCLGDLKGQRLRQSLWGFLGPLAYFAVQLSS